MFVLYIEKVRGRVKLLKIKSNQLKS